MPAGQGPLRGAHCASDPMDSIVWRGGCARRPGGGPGPPPIGIAESRSSPQRECGRGCDSRRGLDAHCARCHAVITFPSNRSDDPPAWCAQGSGRYCEISVPSQLGQLRQARCANRIPCMGSPPPSDGTVGSAQTHCAFQNSFILHSPLLCTMIATQSFLWTRITEQFFSAGLADDTPSQLPSAQACAGHTPDRKHRALQHISLICHGRSQVRFLCPRVDEEEPR